MADTQQWEITPIDCFTGQPLPGGLSGTDEVFLRPNGTIVVEETMRLRPLLEFGGNTEGQLFELVYIDGSIAAHWAEALNQNVALQDAIEAQGPGFLDIILHERMSGRMSFTTANTLSNLNGLLQEAMAVSSNLIDIPGGGLFVELQENLVAFVQQEGVVTYHLLDAMKAATAVSVQGWVVRPEDGISVLDAVTAAYLRTLAEQMTADDDLTIIYKLAELVSALDHVASVQHESVEERVEVIARSFRVIGDLLAEEMTADATVLLERVSTLLESMVTTSGMVLSFPKALDETIEVTDGVLTAGTLYKMLLEEGLVATAWVRVDGDLSVFCINPRLKGVTTYEGWDFNSYATDAAGTMWAANDEGVWRITEKPEDAVKSTVRFAKTSFGTESLKAIQQAYLGMSTNGKVVLKYTNDEGTEAVYTIKPIPGLKTTRVKLAKGSIGRWFEFELSDEDATELVIDEVSLVPLPLSRVMR